jgi:hypothetical protein
LSTLEGVELTKAGLEKWVIGLREKGLTTGGVNVYIRTVNSFLSWLREEGTEGVPAPLKLLRALLAVKVVLTDAEVKLLTNYRPANRIEKADPSSDSAPHQHWIENR